MKIFDFWSQCFSLFWWIPPWRSSLLPKPPTHIMLIWTQGNLNPTKCWESRLGPSTTGNQLVLEGPQFSDLMLCANDSNELKWSAKGKCSFVSTKNKWIDISFLSPVSISGCQPLVFYMLARWVNSEHINLVFARPNFESHWYIGTERETQALVA